MSIAVSVVVMPSRLLLTVVAALCACASAIGGLIGLGMVGELAVLARLVCALLCISLVAAGFVRMMQRRKIHHLDISGSGQISLRIAKSASREMPNIVAETPNADGILVTLLADSTLWPHFLMLRLQDEDGKVHPLPILADSLPAESFRAVSVACRWIAAHRFSGLN
jgi:toxin CptA